MPYVCSRCGKSSKDWKLVRDGPPESTGNVWCGDCVAAVRKGIPVNPERERARLEAKGERSMIFMGCGCLVAIAGLGLLGVYLHHVIKESTIPAAVLYAGIGLLVGAVLMVLLGIPSLRYQSPDAPMPWEVNPQSVEVAVTDVLYTCAFCIRPILDATIDPLLCVTCSQGLSIKGMAHAALATDPRQRQAALDALGRVRNVEQIDQAIREIEAEPPPEPRYYGGDDWDTERRTDHENKDRLNEYRESVRRRCSVLREARDRLPTG